MAIRDAGIMNESCLTLVHQNESANFDDTDNLTIFTVPVGKEFTPYAICISKTSGDLASSVVSFGKDGALTNFLGNQTLSNLNAAGMSCWLMPVPNATPAGMVTYTAGQVFLMDRVTAAGVAATADVSVFGFLNDA